uniref:NR LBD domain-containing protein n=1 Tax=Angiostrongylus cantonensis TaxID=6313 RepID=A0A158PCT9_ANGCA
LLTWLLSPAFYHSCLRKLNKLSDSYQYRRDHRSRTIARSCWSLTASQRSKDSSMREILIKALLTIPSVNGFQMRYEPFRMAKNNELSMVAYRRLIAAIDWVEHLSVLIGGLSVDDRVALVKNAFAPLMVFKFACRTAEAAKDRNILCLCNFAYVPRNISAAFSDSYHLGNGLVDRALDELVQPYRAYGMREEEIVCVSAMIVLNPLARDLSVEAFDKILELRNKIEDALYVVIKEARSTEHPAVCFGRILLSLPIVTMLANSMCENLQFAQIFSNSGMIPLLTDLFGRNPPKRQLVRK